MRVEAASRKLADTDKTIAAVAVECGFYDHAHFTRSFHAVTGISPSRYRREHQSPGL
ncbi:transcriptional regulator, AraC family [Chthoniobacter flavus Ellin428]|uniref:Transcriptional regulator, AraC family n=1 Tax=Chthoniobacter flavus Ellin428 TaxID=497964 RepID=B4DB20_9BACT|nr:transcriptional regulator, AraC family [Chthoniobacter flavus Ellin428]